MLIGEGPGVWEDREGIPFVGRSGQEQDQTYFPLAGLDRQAVFVTNCVQCRQERGGVDIKPSIELTRCCSLNHLYPEIMLVKPEVIILSGATACAQFGINELELEHGFPQYRLLNIAGYCSWQGWLVPMYHPAAGMHETRYMTPLLEDWARLGKWMKDEWKVPDGQRRTTDYGIIDSARDLERELESGRCIYNQLPCDSETNEGHPYSLQFSTRPEHSRFIKADRKDLVRILCKRAEIIGGFILHNAGQDIDTIERAGGWVIKFRDTMQELYHLGNLPQGLKAAVYRVFGYRMTSYDEVVTPYSKTALDTWLAEALAHVSMHMRTEVQEQLKTKVRVTYKPHEAEAVLRRVMAHLDSDYDPWELPKVQKGEEKPRLIGREWLLEIEQAVGRMPRKSIVHAPIEKQIEYACGDADWTGRLAAWLDKERARIVQQEWRVA